MTVICPYCNQPAKFIDSIQIYNKSFGMVYACLPCQAWVGVHNGTNKPLGRLADRKLRMWKQQTHAVFDPIWQGSKNYPNYENRRSSCYAWLAKKLGISYYACHIGMFDIETCKKAIEICQKYKHEFIPKGYYAWPR